MVQIMIFYPINKLIKIKKTANFYEISAKETTFYFSQPLCQLVSSPCLIPALKSKTANEPTEWSQCSALHWAPFTKTTKSQSLISCSQKCSQIELFYRWTFLTVFRTLSMFFSELFVSDASLIIFLWNG